MAKARIVCVEDEPEMIELIRTILQMYDYEVVGVIGGSDSLETIRREKPDLILLDLMMPEISGWEIYRRLRADPDLCSIPVIPVTAQDQPMDILMATEVAGVDGYVTKPFTGDELVSSIEAALSARSRV